MKLSLRDEKSEGRSAHSNIELIRLHFAESAVLERASFTDQLQLTTCLTGSCVAATRAEFERQQDNLIHSAFEISHAHPFLRLEDLARRGLELVPDVAPTLEE